MIVKPVHCTFNLDLVSNWLGCQVPSNTCQIVMIKMMIVRRRRSMIMVINANANANEDDRRQEPSTTCSMLGLGGCGVTKNQIAEAKFNQVVATSSGFSNRTLALPNMALEKAP